MNLSERVREALACPRCGASLESGGERLCCVRATCGASFPIVRGVPILINSSSSTFDVSSYTESDDNRSEQTSRWQERVQTIVPRLSINIAAKENYRQFRDRLVRMYSHSLVLIIGGAGVGEGMEELLADERIEFVEADVALRGKTRVVCDAQDLPFASDSFDGVIIQAVLEYLFDPARCVAEIYRVLKADGQVYSEMPFMQQVHGGKYDFTRFTLLGHRVLYRRFAEVSSGACCGPGMALAWSVQYFLLSFSVRPALRNAIKVIARCSFFWLKYFDRYLAGRGGALDAASGTYFLGTKTTRELSNRELIQLYRGGVPADNMPLKRSLHA